MLKEIREVSGPRDKRGSQVPLEYLDLRVLKERKGTPGQRETPAHLDPREVKDLRESLDMKESTLTRQAED